MVLFYFLVFGAYTYFLFISSRREKVFKARAETTSLWCDSRNWKIKNYIYISLGKKSIDCKKITARL